MKTRFLLLAMPLLALSSYAAAIDYPDLKEGLWSSSVTAGGQPPHTGQMCNSNAVFKAMAERAKTPGGPCTPSNENRSGNTFSVQVTCNFGGQVRKSTNITTMTGNTASHTEVRGEDGKVEMVTDAKYIGACPAGMVPGDYVDSSGAKFNILQMGVHPAAPPGAH